MREFWRGRRVFVTGQTGFKGAWLCLWLEHLGARVSALALPPHTNPSLYALAGPWQGQDHARIDLRDAAAVAAALHRAKPQVVFHLAAQALVRAAYRAPVETYATNLMGTVHLLDALRGLPSVEAVVIVTTDKVYENDSRGRPFVEDDRLGGHDPYSDSKACSELATRAFRASFFSGGRGPAIATARAGNVIGGGDWSEDRLVPDIVRAWSAGQPVVLRNPHSVRPWQHVLEPLSGYLMLAERLAMAPEAVPTAINFGPDPQETLTVLQMTDRFGAVLGTAGAWVQASGAQPPEPVQLALDSSLARDRLGWRPLLSAADVIGWTADWYVGLRKGEDARRMTLAQIAQYEERSRREPVPCR